MSLYRGDERLMPGGSAVVAVAAGLSLGLAVAGGLLFGPVPLATGLLSAALAAAFVVLTALSALELLGGSADPSGGTHVLVHEVTEGVVGFLTGWFLLVASCALAAVLAVAAGEQLAATPALRGALSPATAAVLVLALIGAIRLLSGEARSQWRWLPVGVIAVGLAALMLGADGNAVPRQQASVTGLAGWLALGFAPLEVGLTAYRWRGEQRARVRSAATALAFALIAGTLLLIDPVSSSPSLGARLLVLIALLLAVEGTLRLATHALSTLVRLGALPAPLGRPFWKGRLRATPAVALLGALLLLLPPIAWTRGLALVAWIMPALALNAAAIHSRRTEPDRRRPLHLPLHPAAPSVALAAGTALILGLPGEGWAVGAVWLALGGLVYLLYARRNQVKAEEGTSRFTGKGLPGKPEKGYRVLVPLRSGSNQERKQAFPLALRLAEAGKGDVLLLRVLVAADPLAEQEGRRRAREEDLLFRWASDAGEAAENVHAITRVARSRAEGILDTAVEADCDLILLASEASRQQQRLGRVIDPVTRAAPRDVAVLLRPDDPEQDEYPPARILFATRGGPQLALMGRLALSLAHGDGALVQVLNVVDGHASADDVAEAEAMVERAVTSLRERAEEQDRDGIAIEGEVTRGTDAATTIARLAKDYDLVIMGATEQALLDRVLFGTVPHEVARLSSVPVLLGRAYRGLPRFWLRRLWDALYGAVPKLGAEEQVEVYQRVRRSARARPDFLIMIGLASLIATFGLQQDNPAVIIGAMLVAPLFSPVIALSLGVARGDGRLLRLSAESALKGILLAVFLAFVVAELLPMPHVTGEMTSRTQPGLLDLGVALAAGAAGAYAMSRARMSASLPGVAIAAALVPPLAVVGMGLAWRSWETARGATLLFGTNLVAITLAGALIFLLVGYRPAPRKEQQERLRFGLVVMVVGLVLVSAPLAVVSSRSMDTLRTQRQVEDTLRERLAERPDTTLVEADLQRDEDGFLLTATVAAAEPVTTQEARSLERALEEATGSSVTLRLVIWPVVTTTD